MLRFMVVSVAVGMASVLVAAPVPPERPAKALVDGLSDPSEKVRDESFAALRDRTDALPWLRRVARSTDPDAARRAAALLTLNEEARQVAAPPAIDVCVREGRIDLLTEWHQFWKPRAEADLWAVGPRAAKAGVELFAKSCPKAEREWFEQRLAVDASLDSRPHDGPCPERFEGFKGTWTIRATALRSHCPA